MSYNGLEVSVVVDYKQMYRRMFQETTRAIQILIEVQRECEEVYISAEDTELTVFPGGQKKQTEET